MFKEIAVGTAYRVVLAPILGVGGALLLARYTNLLTSCKLTAYLADIDEQAEDMFFRLVKQLAEKEGVTEQLKAENQMLWVKRMNNIRNRATEIVNAELIYV